MSSKLVMQVGTALVIDAVTIWEIRQLWLRPHDPALRVLVAGLVGLAISLTLGINTIPALNSLDDLMDESGLGNAIWMFMAWSYATFFWLVSAHPTVQERQRRVTVSLTLFFVAMTAYLVVDHGLSDGTARTVLFVGICYGYALTMYGIGAGRALRYLHRLRHRWARAGVLLATIGGAAMSIGVDVTELVRYIVLPLVTPGVRPPWMSDFYNVGRVGGQIVLALGLSLVPLATVVVRLRARKDRKRREKLERAMYPLWRVLTEEFPWLVLPGNDLERDFTRTSTEITDGLARLSTYVHRSPELAANLPAVDLVVEALAHRRDGRSAAAEAAETAPAQPPYPQLEPDFGSDWRARAQWMVDLSRELERRGAITAKGTAGDVAFTP